MLYFSPWKTAVILIVILLGAMFAVPNFVPESARFREVAEGEQVAKGAWRFLPNRALNLGLDLRGGSHLLYEVDLTSVRQSELEGALERAPTIARDEGCAETGASRAGLFCPVITAAAAFEDYATLRIVDPSQFDETLRRLRDELARPPGQGQAPLGTTQPRLFDVTSGRDGDIVIRVTDEYLAEVRRRTITQSIEIIRRRIDELGTTEPVIQRQGAQRILVQAPGEQDPQRLKDLIGRTAQMTFHLVASENPSDIQRALDGRPPPSQELLPTDRADEPFLLVQRRLDFADTARGPDGNFVRVLSGQFLRNASQGFHYQTGEPVVNFTFDTTGAVIFGKLTANHIRERFAVVLDGQIITAPQINSAIPSGSGFIEGSFTIESASDLAALLNAGALPAPLTIVDERSVSASLGADSVNSGSFALMVGFLSVVVFMIVAYGRFGAFATVSLFANVVLIAGALSGLQATLTLPGIAGIILTIGMAVDANVLIFERIREEARSGRTPANAIEAGYARALSAILDANITTLIAAALLFQFGSGPVRGFAVTLGIGIVTSVFTAFVFSRLMVATWYRTTRPRVLAVG
jgi:preprotein translocase subunit SecD